MAENSDNEETLEAYYGLPREVKWCKKCVISNQRPSSAVEFKNNDAKTSVVFDEDGVCSACNFHHQKYHVIDWDARHQKLLELCDLHRSKDGSYDVVVPGSGGKDSSYVSHVLKNQYGMHPLTVTWTPNIYTEPGRRNFEAWLENGCANITVRPAQNIHRRLTRDAFLNIGHPFQPFMLGQKQAGPKTAFNHGIKLVMYGESMAEWGSNIEFGSIPTMDPMFYSVPRSEQTNIRLAGYSYEELLAEGYTHTDLIPYLPIAREDVDAAGIEVHHMSFYELWRPQDKYYYAVENCGFQPHPERVECTYTKYASFDDKIDPLNFFMTHIKFGHARCANEASGEIRNHHITREEGVALARKYDGEFPALYFKECLEYMGIDEETFWKTVDSFRSPHLWKKEGNEWLLRHPVE